MSGCFSFHWYQIQNKAPVRAWLNKSWRWSGSFFVYLCFVNKSSHPLLYHVSWPGRLYNNTDRRHRFCQRTQSEWAQFADRFFRIGAGPEIQNRTDRPQLEESDTSRVFETLHLFFFSAWDTYFGFKWS